MIEETPQEIQQESEIQEEAAKLTTAEIQEYLVDAKEATHEEDLERVKEQAQQIKVALEKAAEVSGESPAGIFYGLILKTNNQEIGEDEAPKSLIHFLDNLMNELREQPPETASPDRDSQ